jgi:hypothetical protein
MSYRMAKLAARYACHLGGGGGGTTTTNANIPEEFLPYLTPLIQDSAGRMRGLQEYMWGDSGAEGYAPGSVDPGWGYGGGGGSGGPGIPDQDVYPSPPIAPPPGTPGGGGGSPPITPPPIPPPGDNGEYPPGPGPEGEGSSPPTGPPGPPPPPPPERHRHQSIRQKSPIRRIRRMRGTSTYRDPHRLLRAGQATAVTPRQAERLRGLRQQLL